jgi:hypothetical protein
MKTALPKHPPERSRCRDQRVQEIQHGQAPYPRSRRCENPKPEFATLAGYLNIDGGTGRARGVSVFGPAEAAAVLRHALAPFEDLGVAGASTTRSRNLGGTDSTSFNNAGLPGILFAQDPIEYNTHTHHTNLDTYERIVEADVKSAAIVIAGVLYELALRDEILPRFSKVEMPPGRPPAA